ncbi:hypothetical protein B6U67_02105 [Methanosarcinales archaeon ex4484_138]|nr:MAG: hypothetical protein B6U67_02105 [Methanosarcinales archaeon ex4484_138]
MVHISDGILSTPILVFGWAISIVVMAATIWWSGRRRDLAEEIPKLSVMTAAFFIASLIHIPVGPTSVHFILSGLLGVVLGVLAYPAIFIGVVLQAFLFQHGGVTTIGVNTLIMGISALIAGAIFKVGSKLIILSKKAELTTRIKVVKSGIFAVLIGGLAIVLAVFLTTAIHTATGKDFFDVAFMVTVVLAIISLIATLLRVPNAVRNRIFCAIFAGLVIIIVIFSIFSILLTVKGENFFLIAISLAAANSPVILIEAVVIGFDIAYLVRAYSAAKIGIFSGFIGGFAVLLAVVFNATVFILSGEQFLEIAGALVAAHIPIIIIEAVVTGSIITFLIKVKPELIGLRRSQCET